MFQMLRWDRCEKGHDLHPGAHSGLNAGTCVLENKAIFWCDAQALGGPQKASGCGLPLRISSTGTITFGKRPTCS